MNISQYINQGGIIVYILIIMLGLGLTIMLWKFLVILSIKFKKNRCERCLERLPNNSDISMVELFVHDRMHSLEMGLDTVKIIATTSPLLGLLGTVIGIYTAFQGISTHGLGDPSYFADGIAMAMITTIGGLIVAIPHYIGYNYLVGMMDKLELSFTQELYLKVKQEMRKKREILAPDLTPVIDIVFILLIFFMVTSVFKKEDVILALNLPKVESSQAVTKDKILTIELSKKEFAVDGKKETLKSSKEIFKNLKKDTNILIRIDKKVEYERVMKLFDILKQNQLTSFSLVASEN